MTKQITTYTANVTGIAPNNAISPASEITARQNTSTAINNTGEVVAENRALLEAIHTSDHIINVISTSFSGGTNELSILANAITWWDESVYRADKTADASLTGWGAKTITGLTSSNSFYIWATFVSGTKDYEATNITAALPSNLTEKCLIGIATVSGAGAVTFAVNWQGPTQTRENYFRDNQTFLNGVTFQGGVNFLSSVTSNGTAKVYALPTNYHDVQIEYLTASTISIKAGSRCRSTDDTKDIIFPSDYTINMTNATPTSTTGGRTVAEAANTWYYLYVGLDSSNLPLAWLDTANLASGGTPTNPAAYSTGRRQLKIAVRNDSGSNFLNFLYIDNNFIEYFDFDNIGTAYRILNGTSATYAALSASTLIPPISRKGLFNILLNASTYQYGTQAFLRPTGGVGDSAIAICGDGNSSGVAERTDLTVLTNTSQSIDYKTALASSFQVFVKGYIITEVK